MKARILCSMLVLWLLPTVVAQNSALSSLVETERSFARAAAEKNTQEAFLAFIADDGILFRPNAVNGKRWMQENPMAGSSKRPLLSWQPIFADLSEDEDLGYTTGPWEYKADVNDKEPVAFGNFVTVWKRQPDSSWKFVIDLGISNPRPKVAAESWQPAHRAANKKSKPKTDLNVQRATLLAREQELSNDSRKQGFANAFNSYTGSAVRLYRNDKFPFIGRDAVKQELASGKSAISWTPAFADVSTSGDLGYVYGTYEVSDNAKTISERGNYMRIWKREHGNWRVVLDVANPVPPQKKS